MHADPEKISYVTIEASKMGESNFNNNFDWENAMFFKIPEKCECSTGYSEYMLKEKRFKNVANCDKTNKQEPAFHCINRFMDSESSCNIPWLKKVKSIIFILTPKNQSKSFLIKVLYNINFSVYFLLFPCPKNFSIFFSSHWKK